MKKIWCYCLLFICWQAQAQIVNTERLRINSAENGWTGNVDFSLNFTRNTRSITQGGMRSRLEYLWHKQRLMFFNDLSISRADTDNLINKAFQHIRYNYGFSPGLTLEAFGQVQYNQIQKIGFRSLLGGGPRFKLIQNDSTSLFLGSLYMYEYEQLTGREAFTRTHRMSFYLSAAYSVNQIFSLNHITYYQPSISQPADFRLSTESSLNLTLTKRLVFKLIFQLLYDSRQPAGIPPTTYSLRNTLGITF
ncbi:MAG: DUF481 domain-containing protein [Bacteroidetes bacterium]|nr:MAG: DUF481 domain-containing protein [Bacteroidota bacterium]